MEHRSDHAGNYSEYNRKLFSDGNECKRLLTGQFAGSSNGKCGAASDDYFRRCDNVLPGRISNPDSKCRQLIPMEHGSYDTSNNS